MKRLTWRVLVFLLIGAVINVAVAWSLAACIDVKRGRSRSDGAPVSMYTGSTDADMGMLLAVETVRRFGAVRVLSAVSQRDWVLEGDSSKQTLESLIPFELRKAAIPWAHSPNVWPGTWVPASGGSHSVQLSDEVNLDAWGWPLLAMWCTYQIEPSTNGRGFVVQAEGGIPLPVHRLTVRGSSAFPSMSRGFAYSLAVPLTATLPLRIAPICFTINSFLYAMTVLAVFHGGRSMIRSRRRHGGRCLACAYPTCTSPVCSECGKPVKPRTAAPA